MLIMCRVLLRMRACIINGGYCVCVLVCCVFFLTDSILSGILKMQLVVSIFVYPVSILVVNKIDLLLNH